MVGVMDQVRTWASEADRPRAAFYSAREEPDEKDAGGVCRGKKVTNVTLMEEIEMLKAQLGSLMMDAANVQRDAHPATPAAELLAGTSLTGPRIPALSEGIANGPIALADLAQTIGPPPTTRPSVLKATPKKPPYTTMKHLLEAPGEAEPGTLASALAQQSTAITALVAHLTGQDPMMELASTSSSTLSARTRGVQRRDRMMSDLALGNPTISYSSSSSSTEGCSHRNLSQTPIRTMFCLRCVPSSSLRKIWGLSPTKRIGLPPTKRIGLCDVALGSNSGRSKPWGPSPDQGASGVSNMCRRAGRQGQRRLESGFHAFSDPRPSSHNVPAAGPSAH